MPYIPPSHTCFGQDLPRSTSYLSQHHPMLLPKGIAIANESINHWQQATPGIESSQPESEKGLQPEHVSIHPNCVRPCKTPSIGSEKDTTDESKRCIVVQGHPSPTKKSGELVNSALRPSKGTTKTRFSKVVRFNSQLEHAISFFREDMPLAISTDVTLVHQRETPFEWEASLSNFPADTPQRLSLPVRVESAFMSLDNTKLVGSIAVTNIAYHKVVIARYTLDYWKTASDVVAEFNSDSHQGNHSGGYDYFNFRIKITDKANLELKELLLAVKYCVNGQEYWDNNNSANFEVRFKKKPNLHKFKDDVQVVSPLQSKLLPKSHKELAASIYSKPPSIPPAFENFANATGVYESDKLKQLVEDRLSGLKSPRGLKGHEYSIEIEYSTPIVLKPSAQPFSSRYNFDSSLSAAIHSTKTTPAGCGSLVTTTIVNTERQNASCLPQATSSSSLISTTNLPNANKAAISSSTRHLAISSISPALSRPCQALPSGTKKSVLSSEAYNKVLERYCFVRTAHMSFHSYH